MTQIAFHFGAPDKVAYTCRLLRKAAASGTRVLVTADHATCQRLDVQLWAVSPVDFVTHCEATTQGSLAERSSVIFATERQGHTAQVPVLVNLGDEVPEGFEAFARVIEVVSLEDGDRQQARTRWKQYTALGYDIERHDLNLKGA